MIHIFQDELEKIAVTAKQIDKAFSATVKPFMHRSSKSAPIPEGRLRPPIGFALGDAKTTPKALTKVRQRTSEALLPYSGRALTPDILEGNRLGARANYNLTFQKVQKDLGKKLDRTKPTIGLNLGRTQKIMQQPDVARSNMTTQKYRRLPDVLSKSPVGQRVFNKRIGLHEARELRAVRDGAKGLPRTQFASHFSLGPYIDDLVFSATYTGPDAAKVRKAMAGLRKEDTNLLIKQLTATGEKDAANMIKKLYAQAVRGRLPNEPRVVNRNDIEFLERTYTDAMNRHTGETIQKAMARDRTFRRLLGGKGSNIGGKGF